MLIVWGKKKTVRRLGYVAEFCPVCREITPCRLVRIGLTGHLYYISFLKGKLVGHLAQCCVCGYEQAAEPGNYHSQARSPKLPLPQLIQETFPSIHGSRARELAREKHLRSGGLTTEEREDAILEGMKLFRDQVEKLPKATTITWPAGLAMVLTILAMVGAGQLEEKLRWDEKYPDLDMGNVYLGLLAVGAVVTGTLMILGKTRYVRRKVVPVMARCLRPLHPTREELQYCLDLFLVAGIKVGTRVPVEPLLREIEKAPASS